MAMAMMLAACCVAIGDDEVEKMSAIGTRYWTRNLAAKLADHNTFSVTHDLHLWTGLNVSEVRRGLLRIGPYSHQREHAYWSPNSPRELAAFYTNSISYLYANAVHATDRIVTAYIKPSDAPVLDFSGGVGNNMLWLAERGIAAVYTGIARAEFDFARFRARRRGYTEPRAKGSAPLARFIEPYNLQDFEFDPLTALRSAEAYGCILALDVLEHIPHFERTVRKMVRAIRPGGCLCERSPFSGEQAIGGGQDLRVHVGMGGVTMAEAMGPTMKMVWKEKGPYGKCWRKAS